MLLNASAPSEALRMAYQRDGVEVLLPSPEEIARIENMGPKVIVRDLAQLTEDKRDLFDKQDSIRHDPDALGEALMEILRAEI